MSFADIIKTLSQKKKEQSATAEQAVFAPEPPVTDDAVAHAAAGVAEPSPNNIADAPELDDLEDAINLFESIQEIIDDEGELIKLPAKALLSELEESQRGPDWNSSSFPSGSIGIDAQTLLDQLRKGRIEVSFDMISADIPDGWMRLKPEDMVELDLATVYESIPPELIEISSKVSDYMDRILAMPDYFSEEAQTSAPPSAEGMEPTAQAAATMLSEEVEGREEMHIETEPALEQRSGDEIIKKDFTENVVMDSEPTEETTEKVEADDTKTEVTETAKETRKQEEHPFKAQTAAIQEGIAHVLKPAGFKPKLDDVWDGCEQSRSSVDPIDINHAAYEELIQIPGVGKRVAEAIMRYRGIHGSIDSIYDLLCIPGIGPANFEMMTGLSAQTREDRHCALNRLLGFRENRNPSLNEIAQGAVAALGIGACILSGRDGIMIAKSSGISAGSAALYSSLAPKIFRGVGKYIPLIKGRHSNMFALPGSDPRLLFIYMPNLYLAFSLDTKQDYRDMIEPAAVIAAELDWRFSKRAVVGKKVVAKA